MENNVFVDDVQKKKYEYIVENTILEVNRVLNHWKENDKQDDYDDRLALFRTYLSKFFKQQFGWIMYNEYIRKNYPHCTIQNYKLINIDLNLCNAQKQRSNLSATFNEFIENFDFLKFNDLNPTETKIKDYSHITTLQGMIDYKKLENIKF